MYDEQKKTYFEWKRITENIKKYPITFPCRNLIDVIGNIWFSSKERKKGKKKTATNVRKARRSVRRGVDEKPSNG